MVSLWTRRVGTVLCAALMAVPFAGLAALATARAAGAAPTVTNYPGTYVTNPLFIAVGPDGALWFTNNGSDSIGRITPAGTGTGFTSNNFAGTGLSHPYGITAGPHGALWFTHA